MIVYGLRKRFERELRMQDASRTTRRLVIRLGVIGNVAQEPSSRSPDGWYSMLR